jgi:tetratricopeptide (TPR) repeat protein
LELGGQAKHRIAEYVISMLAMTKQSDWIRLLAIDPRNESVSPQSLYIVARTLPDTTSHTIEVTDHVLTKLFPTRSPRRLFLDACTLLDGELPGGFDPDVDFQRFFDEVTVATPTREEFQRLQMNRIMGNRNLGGGMIGGDNFSSLSIPANLDIVEMFLRHGQTDLAASCLEKVAQSGDTEAYFQLGQQALDSGRVEMAANYFDALYAMIRKRNRGGSDDAVMAGKTLVASWLIARRRGDEQQSEALRRELRMVLCSPSARTRQALAEYLDKADQNELALEAYRGTLSITLFGGSDTVDLYEATRGYALAAQSTEPDQAAKWFDLAVLRSIESDGFRPGEFVTLPMYVRRWALQAAIEVSDAEAAKTHLERLLQLDPLDIDLAERLLPKIREAEMTEIADDTFDRILEAGLLHCDRFAFDAMSHNNLAWVAAKNGQRLDDALLLSKRAVTLEPDSAIYRDTLAEILFLRGDVTQALEIEQACILDDPGQWHLHQQIERFKTAD